MKKTTKNGNNGTQRQNIMKMGNNIEKYLLSPKIWRPQKNSTAFILPLKILLEKNAFTFVGIPKLSVPSKRVQKKSQPKRKSWKNGLQKPPCLEKNSWALKRQNEKPPLKRGPSGDFLRGWPHMLPSQKTTPQKMGFLRSIIEKKIPQKRPGKKASKERGTTKKTTLFKVEKDPKKSLSEYFWKKPKKTMAPKKIQAQKNGVPSKKEWDRSQKNTSKKLLANSPPSTMKF
jgi:hypothetical protein